MRRTLPPRPETARDVHLRDTFAVYVTDKRVPVRVLSKHPHGGWLCKNLRTRRTVHIRSYKRFLANLAQCVQCDAWVVERERFDERCLACAGARAMQERG